VDFNWSSGHVAFRERLRDVLKRHLPDDWAERSRYDTSSEYTSRFSRTFCPILAQEGLLIPHWPKELGGEGLDGFHHWILGEEMVAAGEPRSYQYMSVNWVGPTMMRYGTKAQQEEFIPKIKSGNFIWCQGFSEPDAGSDLAALRTRAERRGDRYVINGSKIWTSGASFADHCLMLARTGGERREGITVFLVPMKHPGVEVRVIPNYIGERTVHEVFFTDVEVPAEWRFGDESNGWEIVTYILHQERVGIPRYAFSMRVLDHAVDLLKQRGAFSDSAVRARAGHAKSACEATRYLALDVINDRVKGRPPSAKTSIVRYSQVRSDRLVADFLADYLSDELVSGEDRMIASGYKRTGSVGIASGAAEVQLDLIARNHLDLPRRR
jgi:alkylation response protein AidB-like acyl-CoA dehydrogenase